MVTITVIAAQTHKKAGEKSANLLHCNSNNPTKLNGGPGIIGMTEPANPTTNSTKANITNTISIFFLLQLHNFLAGRMGNWVNILGANVH